MLVAPRRSIQRTVGGWPGGGRSAAPTASRAPSSRVMMPRSSWVSASSRSEGGASVVAVELAHHRRQLLAQRSDGVAELLQRLVQPGRPDRIVGEPGGEPLHRLALPAHPRLEQHEHPLRRAPRLIERRRHPHRQPGQ